MPVEIKIFNSLLHQLAILQLKTEEKNRPKTIDVNPVTIELRFPSPVIGLCLLN